jgi:hypothetical protein
MIIILESDRFSRCKYAYHARLREMQCCLTELFAWHLFAVMAIAGNGEICAERAHHV